MPTALIAEDEPLLRAQLKARLAEAWPELDIVAEAANGREALALAAALKPEVAFLDIRMPEKSGLDVARELGDACHVVFVTAYDEYAVAAFDEGAVDYVLKPPTAERIAKVAQRVRARLAAPPLDLAAVLAKLAAIDAGGTLKWIRASLGASMKLIDVADVLYFQAEDKYTKVITADGEALIRKTIKELTTSSIPSRSGRSTAAPSSTCGPSPASTATGAASRSSCSAPASAGCRSAGRSRRASRRCNRGRLGGGRGFGVKFTVFRREPDPPMTDLAATIDQAFETRAELSPDNAPADVRAAVDRVIAELDAGRLRVAEKVDGVWTTRQWVKKAVLLSFRLADNTPMQFDAADGHAMPFAFYDKVPHQVRRLLRRRASPRPGCASCPRRSRAAAPTSPPTSC